MNIFESVDFLNEGKQAEEHYKKKAEDTERGRTDEFDRADGYIKQNRPRIMRRDDWESKVDDIKNIRSSSNNPSHKTAREIKQHKEKYGSVMPKKTSPAEKRLDAARAKENKEDKYARDVVEKRVGKDSKLDLDSVYFSGNDQEYKAAKYTNKMNNAYDAARRHYRRTHKNESVNLEDIEIFY